MKYSRYILLEAIHSLRRRMGVSGRDPVPASLRLKTAGGIHAVVLTGLHWGSRGSFIGR